jgi:transcriptional regulator with XRE-family HTH domain
MLSCISEPYLHPLLFGTVGFPGECPMVFTALTRKHHTKRSVRTPSNRGGRHISPGFLDRVWYIGPTPRKKGSDRMMGARIAALRRDAGWSQAELGKRLGVSASAVGMYEQGRREPSADTLVALSEIFGVTTDYILTGRPIALPDQKAVTRLMRTSLESAQTALSTRRDQPFTRNELAALFAAMLTDA